ncbi:MAG: hypothetical protein IPO92_06805 [Saprospiraceae bacterium]|nr:hypothetical protein [Saprospiraceae bacterium]
MHIIEKGISNISFGLAILLAFLWLCQKSIIVPEWMIFAGRLHPLMLHLPIGTILISGLIYAIKTRFDPAHFSEIFGFILKFSALTALLSGLFGMLLSMEEAYPKDDLNLHKNTGLILGFGMYLLSVLYGIVSEKWIISLLTINILGVLVTGHLGAEITHGKNFLFPEKV